MILIQIAHRYIQKSLSGHDKHCIQVFSYVPKYTLILKTLAWPLFLARNNPEPKQKLTKEKILVP